MKFGSKCRLTRKIRPVDTLYRFNAHSKSDLMHICDKPANLFLIPHLSLIHFLQVQKNIVNSKFSGQEVYFESSKDQLLGGRYKSLYLPPPPLNKNKTKLAIFISAPQTYVLGV